MDEHAKAKNLSRNRFVIHAIQKALEEEDAWSTDFLDALGDPNPSIAKEVDEMLDAIHSRRASRIKTFSL